jgi:hypothetical protein
MGQAEEFADKIIMAVTGNSIEKPDMSGLDNRACKGFCVNGFSGFKSWAFFLQT